MRLQSRRQQGLHDLRAWLELEGLVPSWRPRMAAGGRPQFLSTWLCCPAAGVSSRHGSWVPSRWVTQREKGRSHRPFVALPRNHVLEDHFWKILSVFQVSPAEYGRGPQRRWGPRASRSWLSQPGCVSQFHSRPHLKWAFERSLLDETLKTHTCTRTHTHTHTHGHSLCINTIMFMLQWVYFQDNQSLGRLNIYPNDVLLH